MPAAETEATIAAGGQACGGRCAANRTQSATQWAVRRRRGRYRRGNIGLRRLRARRAIDETPAVHPRHRIIAKTQSSLRCALIVLAGAAFDGSVAQAADPQPYRVELASTGNGALDATLKATSQLAALRASVPVSPFGLIARARADVDRLKTVLESFGYYQSSVSITINGLALDEPSLGDTLSALPQGNGRALQGDVHARTALPPRPHRDRRLHSGLRARQPRALHRAPRRSPPTCLPAGARLLTALENHGYAFAKVDPPVAHEDPDKHVLNLSFHVVTGPRVQIGEIRLRGPQARARKAGAPAAAAAHRGALQRHRGREGAQGPADTRRVLRRQRAARRCAGH